MPSRFGNLYPGKEDLCASSLRSTPQFLAIETSRTYGHVGGLAVYDPSTAPGGRLDIPEICNVVSERLHMLPPFRWKLVQVPLGLDLPYWIPDDHFDLGFHMPRDRRVPPPGTTAQLAGRSHASSPGALDRSRPLWELYLIHGLEGGRVALLTKVHHSVVDGVSGSEILTVLLDPSPEGREIDPPAGAAAHGRSPSDLEMLGRGVAGLARQPLRALRSVPTALPNLTELPGANAFPGVPALSRALTGARRVLGGPQDPGILEVTTARPPRTCFNGPISAHRSFAFGSVSLDTVKAIKNEAGVKVNDVVVAVCAGAVREFLLERDELPEEPLVAMVPVSVRAEDEQGTFGNRISTMIVPIPTDEADPVRRLERAHSCCAAPRSTTRRCPPTCSPTRRRSSPPRWRRSPPAPPWGSWAARGRRSTWSSRTCRDRARRCTSRAPASRRTIRSPRSSTAWGST